MKQDNWTVVSKLFTGGTAEAIALIGRKVRVRVQMPTVSAYVPEHMRNQPLSGDELSFKPQLYQVGWVSGAQWDRVIVGFLKQPNARIASLEQLKKYGTPGKDVQVADLTWEQFMLLAIAD